MSFLDRLLRRKPTPETVPSQPIETETSHAEIETPNQDNAEILKELKMIYAFLINHDQRLVKHDQVNAEYLTQILLQNKVITPEKKPEVQAILNEAITKNTPKPEVVNKLIDAGLSRATAYRYAKGQSHEGETETTEQSQA